MQHECALGVVVVWLINIQFTAAVECSEVTCLACDREPLILSCPKQHMVTGFVLASFRDMFQGNLSFCGHLPEDCFAEEVGLLTAVQTCMWHAHYCSFTLGTFTLPVLPNTCPPHALLTAKFLFARDFECVPSQQIHALCQSDTRLLIARNASITQFLTSVDFPREYAQYRGVDVDEKLCRVEIRVPSGHGIRVWSVFMDLTGPGEEGSCRMEHLRLSQPDSLPGDDTRSHVFCGQMNVSVDWPRTGLVVHFLTEYLDPAVAKTNRGFALKYHSYVLPAEPSTSTLAVATTTLPAEVPDEGATHKASNLSQTPTTHSALPTPILVLVTVMAAVFLIAVVTVLVMIVCRKSHSRDQYRPNSESTDSMTVTRGHV